MDELIRIRARIFIVLQYLFECKSRKFLTAGLHKRSQCGRCDTIDLGEAGLCNGITNFIKRNVFAVCSGSIAYSRFGRPEQ